MLKWVYVAAMVVGAGLTMLGFAGADESAPVVLAAACVSCHSPKAANNAIPSLVDLDAGQIETALKAFASGERSGTIMNRIAKGYTDAEISALAAEVAAWQ